MPSKLETMMQQREDAAKKKATESSGSEKDTMVDALERTNRGKEQDEKKALSEPAEKPDTASEKKGPADDKITPAEAAETAETGRNGQTEKNAVKDAEEDIEKTGPVRKEGPKVVSKRREVVPQEKKNLSKTWSFSLDNETFAKLKAAVKIMSESGVKVDDRLVTDSSFVRLAIVHEIERLEEVNGEEFKKAIEDEINRTEKKRHFTF